MTRFILSCALLIVALFASYQYNAGYWDSWSSKKDLLKQEILESNPEMASPVGVAIADCVAEVATSIAEAIGCPSATSNYAQAIEVCVDQDPDAQEQITMGMLKCLLKAQMEFEANGSIDNEKMP